MLSFREGDYLTDRRRLYRVVQIVPVRLSRRAAILEDCRTLEAFLYRPKELKRMQLEVVRPSRAKSAGRRRAVLDSSPLPWTTSARGTSV